MDMTGHRLTISRMTKRQRGLTLIEFMVSIVLGMLMIAAIATLIANQSSNRAEIDRAGKMIENGRYAIQAITEDLMLAGYWGQLGTAQTPPTTVGLPDPCVNTATAIDAAKGLHVQGYDASTFTSTTLSCVTNWKTGTDVLVVRHADPATMVTNLALLTDGQAYLQTGLTSVIGVTLAYTINAGLAASNTANFPLVNKTGAVAPVMKIATRIYYVATCDVCTGPGADTIPTLKRVELGGPATSTVTLAEGIESLQFDYGLDADGDGSPDGSDVAASSVPAPPAADWANVMSVKIFLVARATDKTPGFTDSKGYVLGVSYPASAPFVAASGAEAYRRHTFVQSVRLFNPSGRRAF
jgi:type IV pilus assembly protein PilW